MRHSLSTWTVAFLSCGGRYGFLRRADDRAHYPGLWTGLGGRVEPHETADTTAAVLREIEEESGLTDSQIEDLRLRLVGVRRDGNHSEMLLFYSGRATRAPNVVSREGTLEWRRPEDAPVARMIPTALLAWVVLRDAAEEAMVGVYDSGPHGCSLTLSNGRRLQWPSGNRTPAATVAVSIDAIRESARTERS